MHFAWPLVAALAGAAPVKLGKTVELATIPLGDEAHEFTLGVGACRKGECPIEVRYGGKTLKMEWLVPTGAARAEGKTRWTLGDLEHNEESQALLDVTVFELNDDLNAILLTITRGFEHTHREHGLFTVTKRGLERVWHLGESAGPWVSTVKAAGAGEVLVTETLFNNDPESADIYRATRLKWANGVGRFDAVPSASPAIISKPSGMSLSQGRSAQSQSCLSSFLVLDTQSVPGLGPEEVVLAKPVESGANKATLAAEARTCAPKLGFTPGLLESKRSRDE